MAALKRQMQPVSFLGPGIFGRELILGFRVHRDEEEKRRVLHVLDRGAGVAAAGVAGVAAVPDNAAVVVGPDSAALALLHVVFAVFLFLGVGEILLDDVCAHVLVWLQTLYEVCQLPDANALFLLLPFLFFHGHNLSIANLLSDVLK